HARGGFARRGTPAAAIVAKAVLGVVGVVRVARTIGLGDFGVVLGALVGVLDDQADRSAGGPAFERAGQDLDQIRFAPLRGELAGPGLARIEERLDRRFADWQSGRAPID